MTIKLVKRVSRRKRLLALALISKAKIKRNQKGKGMWNIYAVLAGYYTILLVRSAVATVLLRHLFSIYLLSVGNVASPPTIKKEPTEPNWHNVASMWSGEGDRGRERGYCARAWEWLLVAVHWVPQKFTRVRTRARGSGLGALSPGELWSMDQTTKSTNGLVFIVHSFAFWFLGKWRYWNPARDLGSGCEHSIIYVSLVKLFLLFIFNWRAIMNILWCNWKCVPRLCSCDRFSSFDSLAIWENGFRWGFNVLIRNVTPSYS